MIEEARRHRHRARRLLAMVASRGLALPKTHAGLNARFSENFRQVQPDGREQLGRLARALDRRIIADYDAVDTLTTDDARDASADAASFVTFRERLIDAA